MNRFRMRLAIFVIIVLCFSLSGVLFVRAQEAAEERAGLLREDSRLINIKGKIMDLKTDLKKSVYSRSAFVPKNGPGYFILLENRNLEEIEEITRHGEKEILVSGTVTVYNGRNYLLLTRYYVRKD